MSIRVEDARGREALADFLALHDRVYAHRSIRWPAFVDFQRAFLVGESPFSRGRTLRPFLARSDSECVARALAVVDHRYNEHWKDRLGHVTMFEAMPDAREAAICVLHRACDWLASQGARAARAGFGVLEFPFTIDDYETLPPSVARQNPPYYHALLKDAGFETEKGWVDYKIEVRPELIERWRSALETARREGFDIVPLGDVAESDRVPVFTEVWNDAFKSHWGHTPFSEDEFRSIFRVFAPIGLLETSVLAYRGTEAVGGVWATPETSRSAIVEPGRSVLAREKLNFLGIGVRESARGRGVNLAMASYAYLRLVRSGATHLSYTLVLDDNWPSRRTAEKLGASVCASYVVYRRTLMTP